MDEDHWTVMTEEKNAYTFYGPFFDVIEASQWAKDNLTEEYEIRFQDMSPYRNT